MVSGGGHTRCTAEAWKALSSVTPGMLRACRVATHAACCAFRPLETFWKARGSSGISSFAPSKLAAANMSPAYTILFNVHSSIILSADQAGHSTPCPLVRMPWLLAFGSNEVLLDDYNRGGQKYDYDREQHGDQKHMHHASSRWRASDCDDLRRMQRAPRPGRRTGSSVKRVAMCQLDSRTTFCLASQLQGTGCYRNQKPCFLLHR